MNIILIVYISVQTFKFICHFQHYVITLEWFLIAFSLSVMILQKLRILYFVFACANKDQCFLMSNNIQCNPVSTCAGLLWANNKSLFAKGIIYSQWLFDWLTTPTLILNPFRYPDWEFGTLTYKNFRPVSRVDLMFLLLECTWRNTFCPFSS